MYIRHQLDWFSQGSGRLKIQNNYLTSLFMLLCNIKCMILLSGDLTITSQRTRRARMDYSKHRITQSIHSRHRLPPHTLS